MTADSVKNKMETEAHRKWQAKSKGRIQRTASETQAKLEKLEDVLYRRATQTETTVDIKSYRILKVGADDELLLRSQLEQSPELARRFAEEGVLFKQEVTVRQHLPDATVGKFMHEHFKNKKRKEKFEEGKEKEK